MHSYAVVELKLISFYSERIQIPRLKVCECDKTVGGRDESIFYSF